MAIVYLDRFPISYMVIKIIIYKLEKFVWITLHMKNNSSKIL